MKLSSVVCLLFCGSAATPALGQLGGLPLGLEIDPLGTTTLKNLTGDAVSFDAYQITSADGLLSPNGWQSIADQAALDPGSLSSKLGTGALSFAEANSTAKSFSELNLGNSAALAAHDSFGIGQPFSRPVAPSDDLRFFFKIAGEVSPTEGPLSYFRPQVGELRLVVAWDGSSWLWNTGNQAVSFDGYQISSDTQILDPLGWKSISDYVSGGEHVTVGTALSAGALNFAEASSGPGNLAELNQSGVATLLGGAQFYLGHPFRRQLDITQAKFLYKTPGAANSTAGIIDFIGVPEPGGLALFVRGLATLAFGRRWRRSVCFPDSAGAPTT